jgi:hypothetical protein
MSHFTQLNLQGNSGNKPTPGSGSTGGKIPTNNKAAKKQNHAARTAAIGGSLFAAALVATLTLGTNGCSSNSKPATITAPSATAASMQPMTPAPMTASALPPTVAKPAKKAVRRHTLATYKNADYGISFRYPKTYALNKTDQAMTESSGLEPVEMNFIQPGGTTVADVRLPKSLYKGTDFTSGSFKVNVNSKMNQEECTKFAFEDQKHGPTADASDDTDHATQVEPVKMKLGATEYTEVESTGGDKTKLSDAKYYHVFENGACYEFALGMQTEYGKADAKPVDHSAVFSKLNWMLSTVKIAGVPDKTTPAMAAKPESTPATTSEPEPSPSSSTESAPATTSAAIEGGKS